MTLPPADVIRSGEDSWLRDVVVALFVVLLSVVGLLGAITLV